MGKHTPGPWELDDSLASDGGEFGIVVTAKWRGNTIKCDTETVANARLIAAAPTMFDALESLIGLVEELVPEHDDIGEQGHDPENCSICEARIAIRKATGEE